MVQDVPLNVQEQRRFLDIPLRLVVECNLIRIGAHERAKVAVRYIAGLRPTTRPAITRSLARVDKTKNTVCFAG